MTGFTNSEVKARCPDPDAVRDYLRKENARFMGTDHQVDTYFRVPNGRLKLREGTIENALIYYERKEVAGPKHAAGQLFPVSHGSGLKRLLENSLGVLVVVDKMREIYFIGNVKFHIDQVQGLGSYVEIEAQDHRRSVTLQKLQQQCRYYMEQLGIRGEDLITSSYSDMMMEQDQSGTKAPCQIT
jgi:adenylate cyclase class 2